MYSLSTQLRKIYNYLDLFWFGLDSNHVGWQRKCRNNVVEEQVKTIGTFHDIENESQF
jgi:hypothetical protein